VSLEIDLAVLAEGAATDSRGNVTLVGINPSLFLVENFPVQFSPVLLVALKEDESETLSPGRTLSATVEVTGPDDEVLFAFPIRQVIAPQPYRGLRPRAQVVGQVPFTASKIGIYTVSARIAVIGDDGKPIAEVSTSRQLRITDLPSLQASAPS
jgi:hypothetical protein